MRRLSYKKLEHYVEDGSRSHRRQKYRPSLRDQDYSNTLFATALTAIYLYPILIFELSDATFTTSTSILRVNNLPMPDRSGLRAKHQN
jgi:hypothetical protein